MSGSVKLDLSDLLSADGEGLAAILGLVDRGAELIDATPYFKLLIDMKRKRRENETLSGSSLCS
jgi:hypothetical protein